MTKKTAKKAEFVDAQEMHKNHPTTFNVPSEEELNAIKKGDFIKVCVKTERFWVKVEEVKGDIIQGFVDNDLVFSSEHELFYGDLVELEKKNVYDIISK